VIISQAFWLVVVCGHGTLHEANVSEASSDEVPLRALKVYTDTMPKSEDSPSCAGEAESDDKKCASVTVKRETKECDCRATAENAAPASRVKVKSENLAQEAETVGPKIKEEEELVGEKVAHFTENQAPAAEDVIGNTDSSDAAETGVETTLPSGSAAASEVLQPDILPPTNELEKVCSKTDAGSLIEGDGCVEVASASVVSLDNNQQTDDSNADNTASSTAAETGCQLVSCEKNCGSITTSADSGERDDQDHTVESTPDLTVTSHSKCSSPQKLKKLVSKQGKVTPPQSPGL